MKRRSIFVLVLLAFMVVILTGCVPGDETNTDGHPAGFFWGVWHGWIAPISLIIGIFNDHVRVYEVHNTGWWYDLGFYLAVASGLGGLSFTRRRYVSRSD
jgi:hypothetical protein